MIAPPAANYLRELTELPEASRLAEQGDLEVYLATADQIPHILREIGRLREVSFQAVGEGTGQEIDLDRFDQHYLHLFLWDRSQHQIAGAYRLAPTDQVMASQGPEGLYCSTLFQFEAPFLEHLNPALELGRSFVAPAYQKSLAPLLALWKGIATFVSRNPKYHRLFGPVSISQDYTPLSKDLIVRFLRENKWNRELGPLVRPLNPFPGSPEISPHLESIDQVSARIAESEDDGKGIPVLLKQYLKLNATLLEFNLDPAFSNCLDALILVDLHDAPPAILSRYMGKEAYAKFRK
ncbi:GNAT family N-acetyltransferase [Roseibacillus persicicus]|uniref:Hemolysin n=1 Tax=Roseibacillus persicicus TaxID=454148 RepID=A0A918WKA7_9BACT|nr:GNAT family N-acetyltransferase [Roseibacillus persicicus]GHC55247.1 hypothetical protein GCM10007100_22230 [Roseibacillus persicicus]